MLADRRTQLEQTLALLVKEQTEVNESLYTARKSAENLQDESTAELEASIRDIEEINQKVRANLENPGPRTKPPGMPAITTSSPKPSRRSGPTAWPC